MGRWRVVCYPWDLADEGAEPVLDLLQGELGATDIIVPLITGLMHTLRRRPAAASKRLATDGGFHFKPETRRYTAGRIRPITSDVSREYSFLTKISGHCEARGLGFGIRLAPTIVPALVSKHPELCARDVFGVPWNWLCVLNPETAEFLRLISEEIRERFSPQFVEWEGIFESPACIQGLAGWEGISNGDQWLLCGCACMACQQIGSVARADVGAALDSVAKRLERAIRQESQDEVVESWLDRNHHFAQWMTAKRDAYAGLLSAIKRASGSGIDLVIPSTPGDELKLSMVPTPLDSAVGSLIRPCEGARSAVPESVGITCADVSVPGNGVQLPIFVGSQPDGAWLNSTLVQLAEAGVSPIDLGDFGGLPEGSQTGVRQAIRHARRQ